jgi:hypothetical protein
MATWIIRLNIGAIALWFMTLPFAAKLSIFSLGGTIYDLSRLIGLGIVYGNTLFLPLANFRKIPAPLLIASTFFLLYAAILLAIGDNFSNSLNVFVRIYSGFLLLFVFCGFEHKHKMELIENLLLFMGIFTAAYTLIQFATYSISPNAAVSFFGGRAFVPSYSTIRPQGPLLSAGGSASVITIAFILLLKRLIVGNFSRVHSILSGIMALAMLVNLTRTYLFMLVLITIACLICYRRIQVLFTLTVVSIVLILLSFAVVPPSHYLDRFKDVPGMSSEDVSNKQLMQGRGLLMDIVWSDFKTKDIYRQLIGDGLFYTNKLVGSHFNQAEASTHNDFLWLLSNMGVMGFTLYLLYYLSAMVSYRGKFRFLFLCYLFGIMFISGLGGETICVTGHRFLQMICLAYFYLEQDESGSVEVV